MTSDIKTYSQVSPDKIHQAVLANVGQFTPTSNEYRVSRRTTRRGKQLQQADPYLPKKRQRRNQKPAAEKDNTFVENFEIIEGMSYAFP